MRHWLFKPILFFPLLTLGAAFLILVSLSPLSWPRHQAAVAGRVQSGALVLDGNALGTPSQSPETRLFVVRDFFGQTQALRVAVIPDQPDPGPADTGVRILLNEQAAQFVEDKPVTIQVDYRPIPITMATGLAVSLQGIGPADWISQPIAPETGSVQFQVPAQMAVDAIGLRALHQGDGRNYGVEIVRIRIMPAAS